MKIILGLLKQLSGFSGATFAIGAILIVFGVAKGIPGFGLVIDDGQRITAVICGLILTVISIILKFKESKSEPPEFIAPGYKFGTILGKTKTNEEEHEAVEIIEDAKLRDKFEYLNDNELSPTQKRIVEIIVDEYTKHGIVNKSFIDTEMKVYLKATKRTKITEDEMYYRLEFLVKRGYLSRLPIGHPDNKTKRQQYAYLLSNPFMKKFGISSKTINNDYGT